MRTKLLHQINAPSMNYSIRLMVRGATMNAELLYQKFSWYKLGSPNANVMCYTETINWLGQRCMSNAMRVKITPSNSWSAKFTPSDSWSAKFTPSDSWSARVTGIAQIGPPNLLHRIHGPPNLLHWIHGPPNLVHRIHGPPELQL